MNIFKIRPFRVENMVLGVAMLAFVPLFFFASEYAQISLNDTASQAGLYMLYFFIGFVVSSQIGGRMLDRIGAKRPVVLGCTVGRSRVGLWAGKVTQLALGSQVWYIVIAGAGMGIMLTPASTDAVNRASRYPMARPPASPRPSATTQPAWGSPFWARSLFPSCDRT